MKISIEKKIVIGYIVNIIIVLALGLVYWNHRFSAITKLWDWMALLLILLSLSMLTVVYFILRVQLKAKNKSEMQLLENKKLLQSIIDNTTNAVSVKKINGEYLLVNKQYEVLFKLKAENIKGKTDHDILPKEIADQFRSSDLETLKLGKEIQVEEIMEQSDGPHTYLAVKFPLFDASNRVFAVGSISTDISKRKSFQESLKEADTFFNMSKDILVVASKNKFLKINPSLCKILGYSEQELLENNFATYILPEDVSITEKEIEKLQTGSSLVNFRNRWICKDETIKWLSWTATIDMDTEIMYAIARDITEQLKLEQEEKEALKELYENEQKLNLILENISDGVIVANANKKVVLANYMANGLFGTEDDSKIPANFSDHFELFFPDGKTVFPLQKLPMERALIGESTDDIDVVLWNPTLKKKRRVLLSGRPIIDEKNQVIAAVITIKDISKYKKMEEELNETELKFRRLIGFKKNNNKKNLK